MRPCGLLAGILAFWVFPFTIWGQTAPGKPAAPTVTPSDGSLAVSWTAPTDVGSGVSYYDLQYRVLPYGAWAQELTVYGLSYTTGSNLFLDKEYVVQVRAVHLDTDGREYEGPWSDTTTAIAKAPTKPNAPSTPSGTVDDQSVTLEWTMGLGDDGNSAITGWQYVKKVGTGDFETTWNDLSSVTITNSNWPKTYQVTVTGLTNFTAYKFKVRAKNTHGDGAASPESDSLTPVVLTIPSVSDLSWIAGSAVSVTLPEANHGVAPRTYSLEGSLPTGVSLTASTRVLAGTPTAAQNEATYTYKVRDAEGDEDTEEFTIAVAADTNPTLPAPSDQTWVKDTAYTVTLPAASNGNTPLTYTLAGSLPTGVSFNATTRVLSGTPTATPSAKTYTYKVEDANGDEASDSFTLAVEADATPTLSGAADQTWVEDSAYTVTLPAASSGNTPLTYTLGGSLPTGVSFNATTRVLSGTPSDTQALTTYTYKVEDSNGDDATAEFTIAVEADTKPTLDATGIQISWATGTAISVTLPAASGGNEPLTYTLSGGLPNGVNFDTSTRVLSGKPTVEQSAKTYTYKVRDNDGDEKTAKFTIEVEADTSPSLSPDLKFSPSRVTVPEGGTSSYTVALTVQPSSNVTVSVAVAAGGDADLTFTPSSLTFTGTTWSNPQRITVSAAQDDDETDGTAALNHTASGSSEYANKTGVVYVSEIDDDRPESEPGPCVSIPQDIAPTQPLLDGVPFLPVGPSLTSGDGELRLRLPAVRKTLAPILAWNYKLDHYEAKSRLGKWTPIPDVWFMERTVPVTVKDSEAQLPASAEPAVPAPTVAKDLVFSRAELPVARGSAASYAVRLATRPTSDVTLTVNQSNGTVEGLTVSPAQLTFSATNWNEAQVVTVSAAEAEGEYREATFAHSATGGGYDGVTGQVTAQENATETKALTFSASSLDVGEGSALTYTVHLAAKPSSDVVLTIGRTGHADLTVDTDLLAEGDQTSLTFTAANWNVPRIITVTAGRDADDLHETALLEHSLAGDGFGRRISGLENGTTGALCESVYLLSIQAVNRHGVSAFSTAVRATPTTATPAAPDNLRAAPGPGEIELSWSDPQDDTVTGFEYRYTTYSGSPSDSRGLSAWKLIEPTTQHLVEGMRFGVRYMFEVRPRQGEQRGAISRATAIPALTEEPSNAPKGLVATWTGSGEAQLRWDAESWTGSYEYRYTTDDGEAWSDWQEAESSCEDASCNSTVTVEGSPEAYEFELRRLSTLNGDIARARTGAHPSAPRAPLLLASTANAQKLADRWELTWTPSAEGESPTSWQYRSVYLGDRNGSLWSAWTDMQPSAVEGVNSFTVTLGSGESKGQRLFQVRGTNSLGVGEPSNLQ